MWYNPSPPASPVALPGQQPKWVVPSYIGERGLVGNWLFYLGAGRQARDYSGHGDHGEIHGARWIDENLASWALSFDGVDDYVSVPSTLPNTGEITIPVWVKFDVTNTHQCIIRTEAKDPNTSSEPDFIYKILQNNTLSFRTWDGSNNRGIYQFDWPGTADTWYFMVAVYDGSDYKLRVYDSSGLFASRTVTDSYYEVPSSNFPIGARREYDGSITEHLDGTIGGIWIYDRALSEAEIRVIYEDTKPLIL